MLVPAPSEQCMDGGAWPLSRRTTLVTFGTLAAIQILVVVAGSRDSVAFLAALVFAVACIISFFSTAAGLALIILFPLRVLRGTTEISLEELAYAGLFFSTMAGWFLRHAPTEAGRRILRSPLGRSILLFIAVCFLSLITNILFEGSPLWWFRDFVRFSYLLLFFPVAGTALTKRGVGILVASLLIVIAVHGVLTIRSYGAAIASTTAMWQLRYQRVALHEVFSMATLVAAFAIFLRAKSKLVLAFVVVLSLVSVTSLVVSLTRGYWLATALALGITVWVLKGRPSRVLGFALVVLVLVGVGGYLVFSARFAGVVASTVERFHSISAPLRALSIQERMAETRAVMKNIAASPIVGRGLGAYVSYMSPIAHRVISRTYSHNAYLFIWFKLGIVGLAAFLVFYLRGIRRVWRSMLESTGPYTKAIMAAGFALLVSFLPLSVTSPQYYGKSSALIIALTLGAAQAIAERRSGESAVGGGAAA
jgi:O-antigen ligase